MGDDELKELILDLHRRYQDIEQTLARVEEKVGILWRGLWNIGGDVCKDDSRPATYSNWDNLDEHMCTMKPGYATIGDDEDEPPPRSVDEQIADLEASAVKREQGG